MIKPRTDAETGRQHMYDEFNGIIADTVELLKAAGVAGAATTEAGRNGMTDGLEAVGARLARFRDRSERQLRSAADSADKYVHDNPWRTAGMVAAVSALTGLAAGLLISRR